jgi:hypothetical protein
LSSSHKTLYNQLHGKSCCNGYGHGSLWKDFPTTPLKKMADFGVERQENNKHYDCLEAKIEYVFVD